MPDLCTLPGHPFPDAQPAALHAPWGRAFRLLGSFVVRAFVLAARLREWKTSLESVLDFAIAKTGRLKQIA